MLPSLDPSDLRAFFRLRVLCSQYIILDDIMPVVGDLCTTFCDLSTLGSLFDPSCSSIVVISEKTYLRLLFRCGVWLLAVLLFFYFFTFFATQSTKKRPKSHFGLCFSSLRSLTFIFSTFDLVLVTFWTPLASLWAPKIHFFASWELLVPPQRATGADPEPHWSPKRPPGCSFAPPGAHFGPICCPGCSFWTHFGAPEVDC